MCVLLRALLKIAPEITLMILRHCFDGLQVVVHGEDPDNANKNGDVDWVERYFYLSILYTCNQMHGERAVDPMQRSDRQL